MIPTFDLLEFMTKNKNISVPKLRESLGLTNSEFLLMSRTKHIHDTYLVRWCKVLDIPFTPIAQYHDRWVLFDMLQCLKTFSYGKRKLIADFLFFADKVPYEELQKILLPKILPLLEELPQSVKNAIEEYNDPTRDR